MCEAASLYLSSRGYRTETIVISDLDIKHCTDCGSCRHTSCVIRDDMNLVFRSFAGADLLVMATPIHFSGPSSIIKTAMDRFQGHWYNRGLPHPEKVVALLCGGSPEPRFEYTVSILRSFAITTGMEWAGHLEVPDTDRVGSDGVEESVGRFLEGVIGA